MLLVGPPYLLYDKFIIFYTTNTPPYSWVFRSFPLTSHVSQLTAGLDLYTSLERYLEGRHSGSFWIYGGSYWVDHEGCLDERDGQ